jgi:hypothetical protein
VPWIVGIPPNRDHDGHARNAPGALRHHAQGYR